ncbi:MAG: extracellular solute-binding protein, partial [Bacillota bacterium]|nr:extracellular solute-binding protein [Bacillota bacterium]
MAINKGFEAKYPDITMEYYFAGTGRVMTKIAAEAQAGAVGADVIWVGDPADYISFKELGILEAYESPEAAFIDDAYKDPEGYFIGAR